MIETKDQRTRFFVQSAYGKIYVFDI